MSESKRDRILTVFAVCFGILAISNLLKPLQIDDQTGFVLFGKRLDGTANAVAGPLFGLFLAAYAAGIWRMKRYALTMAYIYAAYVIVNLILYTIRTEVPGGIGYAIFGVVYMAVAVGVSSGAAYVLTQRKERLT